MTDQQEPKQHFSIQKLYIKDLSFESPASPGSFSFERWEPAVELNLNNSSTKVRDDLFETVLRITATVKNQETTAFLIEVQYAGLFAISGFDDAELEYLLGSQCMSVLFPYVRELVSEMTMRGGFPPLIMSPVNFDALYQQHRQKKTPEEPAETGD